MKNNSDNNPPKPILGRFRKWKLIIPLLLIGVVIVSAFGMRAWRILWIPDIGDPFDVESFGVIHVAPEENALIEYEKAVAMLVPLPRHPTRDVERELNEALNGGWDDATGEVRQWCDDNAAALDEWKKGTEKETFLYHNPNDLHYFSSLEVVYELRALTRLAYLDCSRLLYEGKPEAAWQTCRAALRCSRHVTQYGSSMQRVIGAGTHALTAEAVFAVCQHPASNEKLLINMLADLRNIYGMTAPRSMMVKCEYLNVKNSMLDMDVIMANAAGTQNLLPIRIVLFWKNEPRMGQLVWQQYIANKLEQIDLPLNQQQAQFGKYHVFERDSTKEHPSQLLSPEAVDRYCEQSFVTRLLMPPFHETEVAILIEQTREQALELATAARIYFVRHGKYAATLEELMEDDILTEIPLDPSSPSGDSMHYKVVGDELYIWGVGENGIDDGGADIAAEDYVRRIIDIGLILGREKDDSVEAQKP